MTERHGFHNAMRVALGQRRGAPQIPAALRAHGLVQMALPCAGTQHLAGARDLEPFCKRFLGLNSFWTTHSQIFRGERAKTIGTLPSAGQAVFAVAKTLSMGCTFEGKSALLPILHRHDKSETWRRHWYRRSSGLHSNKSWGAL